MIEQYGLSSYRLYLCFTTVMPAFSFIHLYKHGVDMSLAKSYRKFLQDRNQQEKSLVFLHLGGGFVLVFFLCIHIFFAKIDFAYVILLCMIGYCFSFFAFLRWNNVTISAHLFMIVSLLGIISSYYISEYNLYAILAWIFALPIYTLFLIGKRASLGWLTITLLAFLSIIINFPPNNITLNENTQILLLNRIILISFFVFIYIFQVYAVNQKMEGIKNLKMEKKQIKTILDSLPLGVGFISKDLKITYANPKLYEWIPIKDTLIGKNVFEVIDEQDYEINKPYYNQVLKGEKVAFEKRSKQKFPPFKEFYIRTTYVPLFNDENEVSHFIVINEDRTEAKVAELEKAKRNFNLQLELKNKIGNKDREMLSQQLFVARQERLLREIKKSLKEFQQPNLKLKKNELKTVINKIDYHLNSKDQWESFRIQFEKIHPSFFNILKQKGNNLSTKDLRHCSYLKMNLSYKEMANLLGVSYKTIEMTSYRIKKKLNLNSDTKLSDYIQNLN